MEIIEASNLWKKFGRHAALRGLSFTVAEGNAFALIGANGAGKTTAIKILMNIIEPTRGTARVLGVDSPRVSPQELAQIGYVSESQDPPEGLTVAEYIAYLRPFYEKWDRDYEGQLLKTFRLPLKRKISALSHGMRMKLLLLCALVFRPKLLVLDEPFSGLDPLVRDEVLEELARQAGEMTVLLSSHELSEIEGLATHVGFLESGQMRFAESMGELMSRFRKVRVTLEGATVPAAVPDDWLQMTASGNVLEFVATRYQEQELGARIGAVCGVVRRVDTEPMGLRSIFTTMARSAIEQGGEE